MRKGGFPILGMILYDDRSFFLLRYKAKYNPIEPATAAFSDWMLPNMGRWKSRSQDFLTSGRKPSPSLPTTSASGPSNLAWKMGWAFGEASSPAIHIPRCFSSVMA
jgi:hypothetical protein